MSNKPTPRIPGEPVTAAVEPIEPAAEQAAAPAEQAQTPAADNPADEDSAALLADKDAEIAELRNKLRAATTGRDKRDNAHLPPQSDFKRKPLPRAVLTEDGWLAANVVRNAPGR